ncbi:cytochrome c3 family protein [Shewanella psychrotolerans]|uniref:cytochrome c3 family protein n=1 Tax=Shewanella psychrotolerans TaxID=2864206 RepID=UPI001C6595D8|nr:cytochrome c3 family protein [Shewanella psychrotolerans]QYK00465.1 cytochrome c3 family protein [Shewanella psychrotolerans]
MKLLKSLLCISLFIAGSSIALAKQSQSSLDQMHQGYTQAEQCLECHGSYEENAAKTAELGKWNPHNSIHGGYVDCTNCHEQNKLTKNYCSYCHEYKPDLKK